MCADFIDTKMTADSSMAIAAGGDVEQIKALAEGGAKNLAKVAGKFESVFLGFLLKQMWESIEKSELLSEGPGRHIYDGLMTTMLADHIAENGGIGIAKSLVSQLNALVQAYEEQQQGVKADNDNVLTDSKKTDNQPVGKVWDSTH